MEPQVEDQVQKAKTLIGIGTLQDHNLFVLDQSIGTGNLGIESGERDSTFKEGQSPRIPEEMLRVIYKCILESNDLNNPDEVGTCTSTLLNCRLTCQDWKTAVDNYTDFMESVCWTVSNIPEFLNSTIPTKVKNLRFNRGLSSVDKEQLDTFLNEIIPNVVKIVFDFPKKSSGCFLPSNELIEAEKEQILFSKLMKSAKNLKEMRINSSNRSFLRPLNFPTVQILYLNIQDLEQIEIPILKDFILSLPNLCKIVAFFSSFMDFRSYNLDGTRSFISDVILAHIQTYPGSLKEIRFDKAYFPRYLKEVLALETLKHALDINFNTGDWDDLNLNNLFEKAERANVDVNEHNCKSLKNGNVYFTPPQNLIEILHKVGFCTKLEKLVISFHNVNCESNELEFIPRRLRKLNSLSLIGLSNRTMAYIQFPDWNFIPDGITTLNCLNINGSIFNSQAYANFAIYFPNLKKLVIRNGSDFPDDFFVSLGKMEMLEELDIQNCSITDQMFTAPSEIDFDDGPTILAISTFNCLKSLIISRCNLLTDSCLIDGIRQSTTLEYLTLTYFVYSGRPTQFSSIACNAINDTGRIKLTVNCI